MVIFLGYVSLPEGIQVQNVQSPTYPMGIRWVPDGYPKSLAPSSHPVVMLPIPRLTSRHSWGSPHKTPQKPIDHIEVDLQLVN